MAVPVLLPGAGVAFVMVAVFHRPVPAPRRRRPRPPGRLAATRARTSTRTRWGPVP
jgi:hypothetical protein